MAQCCKAVSVIVDAKLPQDSVIIQVGNYPPPYGGISMRIKRLTGLVNALGGKCVVFSPKQSAFHPDMVSFLDFGKIILRNTLPKRRKRLLFHVQHSEIQTFRMKWYLFLFLIKLVGGKVVLGLGSLRYDLRKLPLFKKLLFKRVSKLVDHYIAVGPHIADKLIMEGCPKQKISIIPGFVPPDEEELFNPKSISPDLEVFLKEHNPVISANASGIVFYDGKDLYGLDMCVELSARLHNQYPNLGFVCAIAPNGHGSKNDDWEYLEKIRRLVQRLQITPNFYFRICSEPFTPLLKRSDIFVRPTCTDGDANSVREALYLGKPTVASDAVARPEGCLTFKSGDVQDLYRKVDDVLKDYGEHKKRISEMNMPQPHQDLLQLYSHLLRE